MGETVNRQARAILTAAMLLGSSGCRHRTAAAATPAPAPPVAPARTAKAAVSPATTQANAATAALGKTFEDPQHGFATICPANWTMRQDPQNVLTLADSGGGEFDIAVPKLPAHVPGIIPLPAVQSGYVDDCRKRLKDVKVTETTPCHVAGAYARHFSITGTDNDGVTKKLLIYAIVKGDRLYILTGEAPANSYDAAKDAVEAAVTSWKWTK